MCPVLLWPGGYRYVQAFGPKAMAHVFSSMFISPGFYGVALMPMEVRNARQPTCSNRQNWILWRGLAMRLNAEHIAAEAPTEEDAWPEENGRDHAVDPLIEALYRSQAKRLFRLFVRKVGFQDASDLVQETFAKFAGARAERNVVPDEPERYLVRIASNLLRDRDKSSEQRSIALRIPAEDAGLVSTDQIRTLEARDMLSRAEAVIMQLKPQTRSIFIAAHFHGLSRAEIATQTGLSVKGVEKHMTRAYGHLQRCLGDS